MSQESCWRKDEKANLIQHLNLHETSLGESRGAIKQYQDSRDINSWHCRAYSDRFCCHRDQFNPEIQPVEHFVNEVLNPEVAVGTVTGAGIGGCIGHELSQGDKSRIKWEREQEQFM